MTVHMLQITDLHLFADPESRLQGIPTRETFKDVLAHIRSSQRTFDAVVITGDLTHDEQRESYRAVRGLLGDLLPACSIIPGNHDDRALMREVFPETISAAEGPLTFSRRLSDWQLIGLDSHWPGEVAGMIEPEQLQWLDAELADCADRSAAVFLHHPPVPVNCVWLDRIALEDPQQLLDVLARHAHVRLVCAGHVHHQFEGRIGSVPFLTTPSTGVQFIPEGEEPAYDSQPPGYRIFRFEQETVHTEVIRLPETRFPPDV